MDKIKIEFEKETMSTFSNVCQKQGGQQKTMPLGALCENCSEILQSSKDTASQAKSQAKEARSV